MAITAAAPASTRPTFLSTWRRSASTMASADPRIGVINGATIIAPITVAVESETTPALAMTDASTSSTQKADDFRRQSGPEAM